MRVFEFICWRCLIQLQYSCDPVAFMNSARVIYLYLHEHMYFWHLFIINGTIIIMMKSPHTLCRVLRGQDFSVWTYADVYALMELVTNNVLIVFPPFAQREDCDAKSTVFLSSAFGVQKYAPTEKDIHCLLNWVMWTVSTWQTNRDHPWFARTDNCQNTTDIIHT